MIVDAHTHLFPPDVVAHHERYVALDETFATLYDNPKAKLASAEDLLSSMQDAGIDASVALGFAWREEALCRDHNDYLLDAAARSAGRIVALPTLPLAAGPEAVAREAERCIAMGARGFGELRPDSVGVELDAGLSEALVIAAGTTRPLLFHVSEPVGHAYAGKEGFALSSFYDFVFAHTGTPVIGAHWGGGLPFYALMPEVTAAIASTAFDTAGSSLLYGPGPGVYRRGVEAAGAQHVLFGSDFPLLSQTRSRRRIEEAGLEAEVLALVLGGNAARMLSLP